MTMGSYDYDISQWQTPDEELAEQIARYARVPEYDELPDEAVEAFEFGGWWEWKPETWGYGNEFALYDDDNGTWSRVEYSIGIEIRDYHIYDVVMSVDPDGDWNEPERVDWLDPARDQILVHYSFEASVETHRRYYEWVIEHGDDPLGWLIVDYYLPPRNVLWQIVVRNSIAGPALVSARRRGRGPVLYQSQIPDYVAEYMACWRDINEWPTHIHPLYRIDMEWTELLDAIATNEGFVRWQKTDSDNEVKFFIRIQEPKTHRKRKDSAIERDLKAKAHRVLRTIQEEDTDERNE